MGIFISHSSKDDDFVNGLCLQLEKQGYQTWVDHNRILAGTPWDKAVENGLLTCEAMILVLSSHSVESEEVRIEWSYFKDKQKTIIPIRIQDCRMPLRLSLLQYLDFTDDNQYEDSFKKLLAAVSKIPHVVPQTVNVPTGELKKSEIEIAEAKARVREMRDKYDTMLGTNQILLAFPKLAKSGIYDIDQEKLFIGWYDQKTKLMPHIDLTRYQAIENGVSRQHAMLSHADKKLTITDLNSKNGTFISRRALWTRLDSQVPYELPNEAVLRLGALVIQVFFKL